MWKNHGLCGTSAHSSSLSEYQLLEKQDIPSLPCPWLPRSLTIMGKRIPNNRALILNWWDSCCFLQKVGGYRNVEAFLNHVLGMCVVCVIEGLIM